MAEPVVWRLADADAQGAGALVARAFQDSPLFAEVVPHATERAAILPLFFADAVRRAIPCGGAWAVGDRAGHLAGVALWRPMPAPDVPGERSGSVGSDQVATPLSAVRARVEMTVETAVAAMPDPPDQWRYLETIAVDPPRQRQGLGAALLRHLLADAAAHGAPLALFTGRPDNVAFYQRVGLELVWHGTPPGGILPLWAFRTR